MGKQGVLAVTENQSRLFRNYDVKVVDSTGAGDAFNGGLVTALSEGKNLLEACAFANVVSNLAVTRMGTAPSMPTRREIDAFLEAHPSARISQRFHIYEDRVSRRSHYETKPIHRPYDFKACGNRRRCGSHLP